MGVVTQEAHLFHDTLRANSACMPGPTPPTQEVIAGLPGKPRSWTWSEALPDGLDTLVGDRGLPAIGRGKTTVAVARLLLRGPRT